MSKIIFLTSDKHLGLSKYGIKIVSPNEYTYSIYPCLKNKKYIYDFETFNNKISYKDLINVLLNYVSPENKITLLVLEETSDENEINRFNRDLQNKHLINLSEDKSQIYDLIYRIENNALISSSEYSLTRTVD